jgi:nucleotide-binding universal stress UspA family protein
MFHAILVALDCAVDCEPVIRALQTLRYAPETAIYFSYVLPPEDALGLDPQRPHGFVSDRLQQVENQLKDYQKQFPGSQIEIVTGDPAEEILRLANIHHIELIILGTRGLKGVERVISGSVSSQVVAEAPCSVLVVHPS